MITKFKIGYYYKFIGDENKYGCNNDIVLILDKKWHKCIDTDARRYENYSYDYAQFLEMKDGWLWHKKDFIESKYTPKYKVKKLLLDKK